MKPSVQISRTELYEEVWKTSILQLAKRFGISDAGLRKLCARYQIPTPPNGYWARVAAGKNPGRPELPSIDDPSLESIEIREHPKLKSNTEPSAPIEVADVLRNPHPLVVEARKQLRDGRADDFNLVYADERTSLFVRIASASIGRAMRIYNALIRAWEAAGGMVSPNAIEHTGDHGTLFSMGPDTVRIRLVERTEPTPVSSTKTDSTWHRRPPRQPTGRLFIEVDTYVGDGLRRSWGDGLKQRLEDQLPEVVGGLLAWVTRKRDFRLDRECEARQKQAAEARRGSREQREAEFNQRVKRLQSDVNAWHEASRIRAYVERVKTAVASGKLRIRDEEVYSEWSRFSEWYADHLDPLVQAPRRPEEAEVPTAKLIEDLELTSRTRPILAKLEVRTTDDLFQITREQLKQYAENESPMWSELCIVLEALGYDVSKRQYWR